jgi:hypothetical protein
MSCPDLHRDFERYRCAIADLRAELEAANADAQELADALYSQPLDNLTANDRRALAAHEARVHP